MKNKLYSVTEAAKQAGIGRSTLHRWVKEGLVPRHGQATKGRSSACIDLDDVRKHTIKAGEPAKKAVWRQVRDFLQAMGYNPSEVVLLYISAVFGEADLDFMLYCVERLREEDDVFVRQAMGLPVAAGMSDELRSYAAQRLRNYATGAFADPPEVDIDFKQLWFTLGRLCRECPVEVVPLIVRANDKGEATLELVPSWLTDAPSGLLPMIGGHHSVIRPCFLKNRERINRIATKISNKLSTAENNGTVATVGRTLQVLLAHRDDRLLVHPAAASIIRDVDHGREPVNPDTQLPFHKNSRDRFVAFWQNVSEAASSLGINTSEARAFLIAWRKIAGESALTHAKQYRDTVAAQNSRPIGSRIRHTVLGDVFGVDRRTAANWIRSGSGQSMTRRELADLFPSA